MQELFSWTIILAIKYGSPARISHHIIYGKIFFRFLFNRPLRKISWNFECEWFFIGKFPSNKVQFEIKRKNQTWKTFFIIFELLFSMHVDWKRNKSYHAKSGPRLKRLRCIVWRKKNNRLWIDASPNSQYLLLSIVD